MRFQDLIQQTIRALTPLCCVPKPLPETFARIERDEVDGVLVLETQFIAVADLGEVRLVHIHAPKINVLTLFFFPGSRWQLPVYCMELVVFSAQPIVALLDTACVMPMACSQTVQQFMAAAHLAHPHLRQSDDTPDWFEQCRSGQDFFIRPKNDDEMTELSDLHLALISEPFKALLQEAALFNQQDADEHQRCLDNYKNHHRIHAPGLRLMNRSFGEQWTADYMNFLFQ